MRDPEDIVRATRMIIARFAICKDGDAVDIDHQIMEADGTPLTSGDMDGDSEEGIVRRPFEPYMREHPIVYSNRDLRMSVGSDSYETVLITSGR